MSGPRDDPFYVGYHPEAPAAVARAVRPVATGLVAAALAAGVVLALSQDRADPGTFEFGHPRTVRGMVLEHPYPSLLVPSEQPDSLRRYLLVAEGKHGAAPLFEGRDRSWVEFRGTRIARPGREMLEVVAGSVRPVETPATAEAIPTPEPLGRRSLEGEIVDSKCWLGVMKPATGNVHRGCAARCLSGGIPPLLMVSRPDGGVDHILLAGPAGEAASRRFAALVGRPVRVTGQLYREGDLELLRVEQLVER